MLVVANKKTWPGYVVCRVPPLFLDVHELNITPILKELQTVVRKIYSEIFKIL